MSSTSTKRRASYLAIFLSGLIVGIGCLVMVQSRPGLPPTAHGIHSYLAEWNQDQVNYVGQRRGYMVCLALLFCLIVLSSPLRRLMTRPWPPVLESALKAVVVLAATAVLAAATAWWWRSPFYLAGGLLLGAAFLQLSRVKLRPAAGVAGAVILLAIVAVATLPGLSTGPDLSARSADAIVDHQTHFSVIIGPGDRLAAGYRLFQDVMPRYGFIEPTVCALWQKAFGAISFGGYILLIRVAQAFWLAAAACLYLRHARGASLACLFALVFFAEQVQPGQSVDLYPNNTGWRLLNFAFASLALFTMRRKPGVEAALSLGLVAGLALWFNIETGVAVAAGLAVFLTCRYLGLPPKWPAPSWPVLGVFAAATVGSLGLLLLSMSLSMASAPTLDTFASYFQRLRLILKAGYLAGQRLQFEPVPALMFFQLLYCPLKLSLMRSQALGFRDSLRCGLSTMALVWFSYYVNRPNEWGLVALYFLYGLFLIDLLRSLRLQLRSRSRAGEPLALMVAPLLVVICPFTIKSIDQFAANLSETIRSAALVRSAPADEFVSGALMPADVARELAAKANFVRKLSQKEPVTFLTTSSFLIPKMTGIYPFRRYDDLFANLAFEADTKTFCQALNRDGPAILLFDDPDSLTAGDKLRRQAFDEIRDCVRPNYRKESITDGWEIWRLRHRRR